MRRYCRYFGLGLICLLAAGCATQAATSGRIVIQDSGTHAAVSFNEHDRALIQNYYGQRRTGLPPGWAKREGNLPPGLAKRETLPPGLRGDALPYDLERQLASLPAGYVRMRVGSDVVLLDGR